jgi:glycosyltransferase involved in cell wall biosynthesis
MGKQKKYYPFVSVCTPTFNRRPFIENMFQCFRNQNYPKDRVEWIIVDDGTDKIGDLIAKSKIPQIKYFTLPEKVPLGTKRNFMHKHAKGTIIVYMDDDDYYPPDRISHAVERLESNKDALCAGSSEIYIYFKTLNRMVQCGPYGPKHATAGTFAFRAELLKQTQYEDHAALAEERAFLKDYTVPFVQLDPMKTILVFSHEHNTFDKRKMLENPHPDFLKDSPKTVNDFIKNKNEEGIKDFFMNQIDKLLENYEAGSPKMKPDVLEQIKKIEAERAEMLRKAEEQQRAMGGNQIILQKNGEPPQVLTAQDAVNIMQQQQQYIGELQNQHAEKDKRIKDLENMVLQLQTQIIQRNKQSNVPPPPTAEILVKDGNEVINIAPQDTNELPKSIPLLTVEAD